MVYYFEAEEEEEPQVVEVERPLRKVTAEGCLSLGEIRDLANDGVDIRGMRICLFNILFDFDKYDIRPEAEFIISDLSALLRQYPDLRIKVSGHTDTEAGRARNRRVEIEFK